MRRPKPLMAECGCVLEGPNEDGQYDLIENPECLTHGWEYRDDDPERVLPEWCEEEDWAA